MTAPETQPIQLFTIIGDGEALLGAGSGGVARSDDGGRTWRPLAPQLAGQVECIAAGSAPELGRVVLAGGAGGVWRSDDDGAAWTVTLTGSPIYALAMATDRTGALVALAGTAGDGIFRSRDGGRQWASASAGLFDLEVLGLVRSPAFVVDNTAFAATAGGLYRSRNGGRAWRRLETPSGDGVIQCAAIAPAFRETGVVLAGTEDDGLLRSPDGGDTWAVVDGLGSLGVATIGWSAARPAVAVASTAHGLARSTDGGASWTIVAGGDVILGLAAVHRPAGELLVGSLAAGGLIVSANQGETWQGQESEVSN